MIESNEAKWFELNRNKWLHYHNFLNVYLDFKQILIDAKLVHQLPTPVFTNEKNDIVETEEESHGYKVFVLFDLPQCCIVMDEVGGDLNMLNDGNMGGSRILGRVVPKINSTKKLKGFRLLGRFRLVCTVRNSWKTWRNLHWLGS